MRPPICEVCDERFGPEEGALVHFRSRPEDLAWRERSEREGFVGHPPDLGWFCGAHADPARELAELTLPGAMAVLRSTMPAGSQVRQTESGETVIESSIEAIDALELFQRIVDRVGAVLAALGTADVVELSVEHHRRWSPMDGALPPNCPYVDEYRAAGRTAAVEVEARASLSHWNDSEAAASTVMVSVDVDGEERLRVWGAEGARADQIGALCVFVPITAAAAAAIEALAAS